MTPDNSNPYVGLRPFDVDESLLFFGRTEQTLELLDRLHKHHFVAVVGGSGCGKSSLLRAGLIPSLKAGYLVDDSDHWMIAIMKPGSSPLFNLAEAVLLQVKPEANSAEITAFVEQIKIERADCIFKLINPIKAEKNINFFLLVDQFEELFRFAMQKGDVSKKDEAIHFVNIMLELAQQKESPFYVVLTMRSDFIGDCSQFFGLPEAMNQSQYLVPRLNRVQLKSAIEGPAKLYGGKFNSVLTSRLQNELGKVKDELPLLQHVLMRTWDYESKTDKSGELDISDYENVGGLAKALSNHADEALIGLNEEELKISKEIFQALTAIDEEGRKVRRPVLLSELKILTGADEKKLLNIINLFIKDRRSFLVVSNTGSSGDKVIDISHESLIRQWSTLNSWVDEEGDAAANYLQLAEATRLYNRKKKDLLTGSELLLAVEWRDKFKPGAVWANRYKPGFEETMAYLSNSEAEKKRLDDLDLEKKQKERIKKYRKLAWLLLLLLIVVFFMGRQSVDQGVFTASDKSKYQIINPKNDSFPGNAGSFFGKFIFTGFKDDKARLWDPLRKLIFVIQYPKSIEDSINGEIPRQNDTIMRLWVPVNDTIWNVTCCQRMLFDSLYSGGQDTAKVAVLIHDTIHDGGGIDSLVIKNDTVFKRLTNEIKELYSTEVTSVAFSPNNKYILTGSTDQAARIWDLSGKRIQKFETHTSSINSVAYSPMGDKFITGHGDAMSNDCKARLWDTDGCCIKKFEGHTAKINSVAYSSDGNYVLTGSDDKTARLWDMNGKMIQRFDGHTMGVNSVAFSKDGKYIITGSSDRTVILWNRKEGNVIHTLKGHTDNINSVAFSPNGKFILSGSSDMTARLWNTNGNLIRVYNVPAYGGRTVSKIYSISFSPDGSKFITSQGDNESGSKYRKSAKQNCVARLWSLNGAIIKEYKGNHYGPVYSVAFSPDGKRIVTDGWDGVARLWNVPR